LHGGLLIIDVNFEALSRHPQPPPDLRTMIKASHGIASASRGGSIRLPPEEK